MAILNLDCVSKTSACFKNSPVRNRAPTHAWLCRTDNLKCLGQRCTFSVSWTAVWGKRRSAGGWRTASSTALSSFSPGACRSTPWPSNSKETVKFVSKSNDKANALQHRIKLNGKIRRHLKAQWNQPHLHCFEYEVTIKLIIAFSKTFCSFLRAEKNWFKAIVHFKNNFLLEKGQTHNSLGTLSALHVKLWTYYRLQSWSTAFPCSHFNHMRG